MKFFFKNVDNTPLIVFRIIFGTILMLEAWGSIFTGWIDTTFVQPSLHFSFIAFEWLQPLDGNGMYFLYGLMGFLGLLVLLGYYYRLAIISYTILWTYCYLVHKISYNNHYYLMILLCFLMCFMPANRYASLDVRTQRVDTSAHMPQWVSFLLVFQISCVYVFGAIAKMYPDWIDGTFPKIVLTDKANFPLIGKYFTKTWFYMGIAYGGLLFDLLIIPALAYKQTRKVAFFISIFFHSFNSIVFQVGVFPYLSLSFALFFFDGRKVQQWFLPKKGFYQTSQEPAAIKPNYLLAISTYVVLQLFLPLRQHCIQGNAYWTEEGHKMSWRMMLRSASGTLYYKIHNITKDSTYYHRPKILTAKQKHLISTHPDVIWQYAQYLKKEASQKGSLIQVYAISKKRLNGRPLQEFIDPTVDLANTPWDYFYHAPWIREFKGWKKPEKVDQK
ncbi:HTTM domain-containing protein [Ochrovirga pacifica]|uniref:HTTM domain-containing protein n=1 Tax=Ochrovirga pacifica TaxID=1042376 RepID=UPI0002559205|nr:HTTM domain-containing protein [Ochrovirga pacifica]